MPHGAYLVKFKVTADGGGYKYTQVSINVYCSLALVAYDKKFTIPYNSTSQLLEIFKAQKYLADGGICPLQYSLKQNDCLTDLRSPLLSYSSEDGAVSAATNESKGYHVRFCVVANNSLTTTEIDNIEVT